MSNVLPSDRDNGMRESESTYMPEASYADFQITGGLGEGMQAVIYRAQHLSTGATVAVKVAKHNDSHLEEEASLLEQLNNPHIVQALYRSGRNEPRSFVVMPVLYPLENMHRASLWSVLAGIAEGIDYAHDQGIIHRDIKPDNFMISGDGEGVLVDFANACKAEDLKSGRFVGAFLYMAPEVADGQRNSAKSDGYSFAASAYQLVFGVFPNPQRELPSSIRRALAVDPNERYSSATEFIYAFRNEVGDLGAPAQVSA